MLSNVQKGEATKRIVIACIELFVQLTWPIDVGEELKEDESADEEYTSLFDALISYKQALMRPEIIKATLKLMVLPLSLPRRDRLERDEGMIRLMLFFYRNLAAIKDTLPTATASTDANAKADLQSALIDVYQKEKVLELLLTLSSNASSSDYVDFNVLVLDIIYNLFSGIDASTLATCTKDSQSKNLEDLLSKEDFTKRKTLHAGSTRHNRFGTTVQVQLPGGTKYIVHKQNAVKDSPITVVNDIKKKRWQKTKRQDQLDLKKNLQPEALQCLRSFSQSFLDCAFNPFFESLLKDFIAERPKVKEEDHLRYHALLKLFLLSFLLSTTEEDELAGKERDFGTIGSVMRPDAFTFSIKRIRMSAEDKLWNHLHAASEALSAMLQVVMKMGESSDEEYREVADNLQSNVFYESTTLDLVIMCIKTHKDQSLGYLTSVIDMTHVFVRMIEKFSSGKDHMYIRKKRARRKAKMTSADIYAAVDVEEEGDLTPRAAYAERAFQFGSFEVRFANPAIMNTYISALGYYRTLTTEQLRQVISMLHRVFVKLEAERLLYRLSLLELLGRINEDLPLLPQTAAYKELSRLSEHLMRKFFKAVKTDPLLFVEVLFPPQRITVKGYVHENEDEDAEATDYRFTSQVHDDDQIDAATAVLLKDKRQDFLMWIRDLLRNALSHRQDEVDDDGDVYASEILVTAEKPDYAKLLAEDGKVALLLDSLYWQRIENGENGRQWLISGMQSARVMKALLSKLEDAIAKNMLLASEKRLTDFVRKKPPKRAKRLEEGDGNGDSDDDEFGNKKAKRQAKKEARRQAEELQYKSAAFIDDSDDDEEADRAFFAKEAALRERMRLQNTGGLPRERAVTVDETVSREPSVADESLHVSRMSVSRASESREEFSDESDPELNADMVKERKRRRTNSPDVVSVVTSPGSRTLSAEKSEDEAIDKASSQGARSNHALADITNATEAEDGLASMASQKIRRARRIIADDDDDDE